MKYIVTGELRLEYGTYVGREVPSEVRVVPVGEEITLETEAPNGNVWFLDERGKSGKVQCGSVSNLVSRGVVHTHRSGGVTQEFIEYLKGTLIPDCEDSGRVETAQDFRMAVQIIESLTLELQAQVKRTVPYAEIPYAKKANVGQICLIQSGCVLAMEQTIEECLLVCRDCGMESRDENGDPCPMTIEDCEEIAYMVTE